MRFPSDLFRHCPKCGRSHESAGAVQPFHCAACGFHYYFNPAPAVAVFVLDEHGKVLFIRRAKDPAKGRLAVPGGFVDIGETAEDALRREIREEVNIEVGELKFLCSQPNEYHYADVAYPVLDFFYVTCALSTNGIAALDGVESFCWLRPDEVVMDQIAFPSIRAALRLFNTGN